MRQVFKSALVLLLLLAFHSRAQADTITTFTLTSEIFNDAAPPEGPYLIPGPSGNVVIDTTTGVILGGNLSVSLGSHFSYPNDPLQVLSQGYAYVGDDLAIEVAYLQDAADNVQFSLLFPLLAFDSPFDTPSLIGYAGGPVCGQSYYFCYSVDTASELYAYYNYQGIPFEDEQIFIGGDLTPETAVTTTPEPSTLILLSTGTLGIAGLLKKRPAAN